MSCQRVKEKGKSRVILPHGVVPVKFTGDKKLERQLEASNVELQQWSDPTGERKTVNENSDHRN